MTTFLADGPKNSNRSSTSGFIGICVLGLLCGGFVGWRLLPKDSGKPDVSVSVVDAKGAHAAPAATASIPAAPPPPVVAQLAQRSAAADTDESATRRRLSDGLKAFGGLPGLRAGTPPAPQPAASEPRPEAALTAAPQSPVVEAIKPARAAPPAAPERAALSQAPAATPQAQAASVAPPAVAPPQPQVAALRPPATAGATAIPAPAPSSAAAPASAPVASRAATPDEDDLRFLDMANGMMRRGDIAGARVILNRLYREGSKQAAYALAQTYDPAALRSLNVRGMLADGSKAQALYEEAAAAGIAGAQDRAQALKATAGR